MTVGVISRFHVRNGTEAGIREAFARARKSIERAPGCMGFDVFIDRADPSSFYLVSTWQSPGREPHRGSEGAGPRALVPDALQVHGSATWSVTLEHVAREGDPAKAAAATAGAPDGYEALATENNELVVMARQLARAKAKLGVALDKLRSSYWHIEKVEPVVAVCIGCRQVRTADGGAWETLARWLLRAGLLMSHGYCPACEATQVDS